MKKRDITVMMAAVLAVVACTSEREEQVKEPVPIQLTASVDVEAVTRGANGKVIETDATMTRGIQDEQLANGQTVYVWAKQAGSGSWDYLKAWTLTADGSGALTGSAQYYPLDGSTITMNAVHGNFSSAPTEGSTAIGTLTHSVLADQSAAGNYEKSDLLFGTATGSDASATENIPFAHKLSKIEVKLTAGYGYTASDLTSAVVQLHNVKPTITIDPTNGNLGDASGDPITITPRKDATTGTYEAVIPKQSAPAGAFLNVTTTKGGLTLTSTVTNDVATFAPNTKYVYNVTVMDLTSLPNPQVGDYFYADGTWSSVYDSSRGNVVGLVFSTEPSAIDRAAGFTHGYVIALNDCGNSTGYMWRNANTDTGISNSSNIDGNGNSFTAKLYSTNLSTMQSLVQGDLDGRIRSYLVSQVSGYNSTTFPAFVAATSYTPVPLKTIVNNSGWYLPSIGQLWAFFKTICNLPPNSSTWPTTNATARTYDYYYQGDATTIWSASNNYLEKRLKTDVEAVGETAISYTPITKNSTNAVYRSSTESTTTSAWSINIHYDTNTMYVDGTDTKTHNGVRLVRPVLAF